MFSDGNEIFPLSLPEFQPETNMGSSQLGQTVGNVNYDKADCAFPLNQNGYGPVMVVKQQ